MKKTLGESLLDNAQALLIEAGQMHDAVEADYNRLSDDQQCEVSGTRLLRQMREIKSFERELACLIDDLPGFS